MRLFTPVLLILGVFILVSYVVLDFIFCPGFYSDGWCVLCLLVFCHLSMIFSVSIYVVVITTFGVLAFALVEAPFCVFTCLTW